MAPLYQQNTNLQLPTTFTQRLKGINDGGEYGHLLPVHQTYYSRVSKQHHQKRAKQVVFKEDAINEEEEDVLMNNQYGQDPNNHDAWYVNCDAVCGLQIASNLLIPKYYPDFKLDLVIIGPNEGLKHAGRVTSMIRQVQEDAKVDVMAISNQDYHPLYFQNEKYFKTSFHDLDSQLSKSNVFTKNIKLINRHVGKLVHKLAQLNAHTRTTASSTTRVGLHLQFPSLNFRNSYCQTGKSTELEYQVMMPMRDNTQHQDRQSDVTVFEYEMDLDGRLIKSARDDEESSRDYASFKLKNDTDGDDFSDNNEHDQQKSNHKLGVEGSVDPDDTLQSTDYILSNCNVAVTSVSHINARKLKQLF
ncbi:hypothetical protein KGF57_001458 [Candida theae]|uniref:Survival protein SurE-like phosphatase/nucleotidase domain-containing protein n=1 Tax=Candida theae TaxID=1198502 RepID=A0AAD5FZS0_9ASCO|nr:uncharacterized protein KGF57_001458 [Candida theae]KAI5962724.1 hypothetical protein KGF57_001458 [Candida theae]